ncbi:CLUMA_CG004649, isoform A [Clunio marinus]|uniref:CLUMA_CG004649, isoform A n=1 Tax=Clunio marinus TaxID=568069 RepID=A0A1J1HSA7_9DIPT|nr:CLUMA_CG004649, isoform A [Clunio marinus]
MEERSSSIEHSKFLCLLSCDMLRGKQRKKKMNQEIVNLNSLQSVQWSSKKVAESNNLKLFKHQEVIIKNLPRKLLNCSANKNIYSLEGNLHK